MKIKSAIIVLILISVSQLTFGEITLPAIISDNMVLQQQSTVPLWGKATGNHEVNITTSWNNQRYSVQSDAEGNWRVKIKTPKAGGPFKIIFDDGNKLTLTNILVGEVWVCSGQSNMERSMLGAVNQPVLNSNDILMHARNPQLRLFHIERKVSNVPLDDCKGSWELSSPESAGTFSAVGFQFAKKMQELLKVPVGIIEAAWGGTPISGWMDKESFSSFPQLKILPKKLANSNHLTCLFNGMINPIDGYLFNGI